MPHAVLTRSLSSTSFCRPLSFHSRLLARGRLLPRPTELRRLQDQRSASVSVRASRSFPPERAAPVLPSNGSTATTWSTVEGVLEAEGGGKAQSLTQAIETVVERVIFNCRFFTLLAVAGSLCGSFLCFLKGSAMVGYAMRVYFKRCLAGNLSGNIILRLVEAVDVYLIGTVMLVFGLGLHQLFIHPPIPSAPGNAQRGAAQGRGDEAGLPEGALSSSLFGLFRLMSLKKRPKWLTISDLDELKAKLGHVIIVVLLVGVYEKSKKVPISSSIDLFLLSCVVCICSACLYLVYNTKGDTEMH
eukprot:TRINITY_DN1437_c0_g2_i1.p1 TRINITY_DN1437_c0_g2~~TRINITY_DN1437_c0_g2_i1.p1  ORF type:complete len:301 (+),score=64.08 TRINITY_DN1437_c0_g2_i1:318-1220(+)